MLELLVRTLRGELALRAEQLPALAVTAFARDEDRERALAAGFQSVLQKPYEVAQLIAAIRQLGGANGRSDRSDAQAK
jgi:CheY-like chemotaxis protein